MLDSKLQIKIGQTIAVINVPERLAIKAKKAPLASADVILLFIKNMKQLDQKIAVLQTAGKRNAMVWLAYPKAKQLDTDLNRDILHQNMPKHNFNAVRQIAIDDIWSAMRFKHI